MKLRYVRIALPLVLLALVSLGLAFRWNIGNLSALGWGDIAMLCPIGALGTMLAEKTIIPQAVYSLIAIVAITIIFGHAFCAWVCPVPPIEKLRGLFAKRKKAEPANVNEKPKALTAEEKALLAESMDGCKKAKSGSKKGLGCASCGKHGAPMASRYFILGGALLSALVFGFPVFCLVCPVGLSIASILLFIRLFAFGDVSWTVIVVPAVLVLEVIVFRKWCHAFCPISAFMSIVSRANRTFVPTIDNEKCLETTRGVECERCASVCPEGINPRIPEIGTSWSECIKCRSCIDACPTHAMSMPLLPRRTQERKPDETENSYA